MQLLFIGLVLATLKCKYSPVARCDPTCTVCPYQDNLHIRTGHLTDQNTLPIRTDYTKQDRFLLTACPSGKYTLCTYTLLMVYLLICWFLLYQFCWSVSCCLGVFGPDLHCVVLPWFIFGQNGCLVSRPAFIHPDASVIIEKSGRICVSVRTLRLYCDSCECVAVMK